MDSIKASLEELKMPQSKIIFTVNNTNNNLNKLNKTFDEMAITISMSSYENKLLREKVDLFERKLKTFENTSNTSTPLIGSEQYIISEINDRQSLSSNLIIFNLSESSNNLQT